MKKRIIVLLLLVSLVFAFPFDVNAATTLNSSPYPKVEYGYSANVTCGTIRYINQIPGTAYFDWSYWPSWPGTTLGGYTSGPTWECGTASMSMALSYVGVNKTPYDILAPYNGITNFINWGDATHSQPSLSVAIGNYINGNGKYSPVVIHIPGYAGNGHYMVIAGQISSNTYQILDPNMQSVTTATINGNSITYTLGSTRTETIDQVHQWYNPNAAITRVETPYECHCTVKVTASTTYIKTKPYSESSDSSSTTVETASKNSQYEAIKLVENKHGNYWYKVKTKSGSEGYLYAGDCSYVKEIISDIQVVGVTVPDNHQVGTPYTLTGTVQSKYNLLSDISVYIYPGSSGTGTILTGGLASNTDIPSSSDRLSYYNLGGSAIDNKTRFNDLPVGQYTYVIAVAYRNYYATSATTVAYNWPIIEQLYKKTFNVVSGPVACSHSYSGKVTSQASCTGTGTKTYTCSKCGDSYPETIPALGHSYATTWTKTASTHYYACSRCSSKKSEAAHNWDGGQVATAAKCNQEGTKLYTCQTCKATKTEKIPKIAHSYSFDCDATCNGCGQVRSISHSYAAQWFGDRTYHWHKCGVCGNIADKTTHSESDWIIDKHAEALQAGSKHTQCTVCGQIMQTVSIPATSCSHSSGTKVVEKTAANCKTEGYTGNEVCNICSTVLKYGSWTAKNGHKTEVKNAGTASCTAAGYTGDEVCTACGTTVRQGDVIPMNAHSYASGKCTVCGSPEPVILPDAEPAPAPQPNQQPEQQPLPDAPVNTGSADMPAAPPSTDSGNTEENTNNTSTVVPVVVISAVGIGSAAGAVIWWVKKRKR